MQRNAKVGKRRGHMILSVFLIAVVVAVGAVLTTDAVLYYLYVKRTVEGLPPEIRPFADLKPYRPLGCLAWARETPAPTDLGVTSVPDLVYHVDVLVVGDEEWWADPTQKDRAQIEMDKANYFRNFGLPHSFEDPFGIVFEIRDFIHWDSTDNQEDGYELLQEAIRENGGIYNEVMGWWEYQGEWRWINGSKYLIDILVVLTGQDMDMIGLSPPQWNALIIEKGYVGYTLFRHELSHQYWLQHCGDPKCYVYSQISLKPSWWCGSHVEELLQRRHDFQNDPPEDPGPNPDDQGGSSGGSGLRVTIE